MKISINLCFAIAFIAVTLLAEHVHAEGFSGHLIYEGDSQYLKEDSISSLGNPYKIKNGGLSSIKSSADFLVMYEGLGGLNLRYASTRSWFPNAGDIKKRFTSSDDSSDRGSGNPIMERLDLLAIAPKGATFRYISSEFFGVGVVQHGSSIRRGTAYAVEGDEFAIRYSKKKYY